MGVCYWQSKNYHFHFKWYRHGRHLTPSQLLSIAFIFLYCMHAGLFWIVPFQTIARTGIENNKKTKTKNNEEKETLRKKKRARYKVQRAKVTYRERWEVTYTHSEVRPNDVCTSHCYSWIILLYYMCTFNNISIKLTCAVCILCRMRLVILTNLRCFFPHIFAIYSSCPHFDHLFFFYILLHLLLARTQFIAVSFNQ